jgi:hypothetical protein
MNKKSEKNKERYTPQLNFNSSILELVMQKIHNEENKQKISENLIKPTLEQIKRRTIPYVISIVFSLIILILFMARTIYLLEVINNKFQNRIG